MNAIRRAISEVTSWFRLAAPGGYRYAAAGEFTEHGPQFGVEIFNDAETPMEFVVGVLQSELNMPYDAAVAAMLQIHNKGSVLLPTEDLARAERAANAISTQARINGHPLACRAASAQQAVEPDRREDAAPGDSGFVSAGDEADGSVRYTLSNGQVDEYPRSWCVPLETCYKALTFFFVNGGLRPEWLQWQES